ncbi:hypothetical protein M011DRAFT_94558 [Sporormia fimetaria CBS 119925]|uniref:Uncharacterized protein n=1 Tax=Sporormia fimetaria CBS 119925 TaxID=1340428 RepID=A0A6A6V702_9PLEO|nr:hypothetical protein M011DRAFT_94558 [Sporormia fimetaria CBS 119925]
MARNVHWRQHESSNSTTASARSESARSCDTAPTEYSGQRALYVYEEPESCHARVERDTQDYFALEADANPPTSYAARCSVETYASTSEEDVSEDQDLDNIPEYQVPHYHYDPVPVDAIPTTPRDFADLFPTAKRISIRHDDSTTDGNMNLRIDTQVEERHRKKQSYTLFHLRMQDLRSREFSLRRYCRDSGREVCHSRRKYQKPPSEKRPVLQRASTALASLVHKSDSRPSTAAGLKRSDSGYESVPPTDNGHSSPTKPAGNKGRALIPTNTIKLEFSNYAHLDVKRRGAKSSKRYSFEYWGHDYAWKRIVQKEHHHESATYYLVRSDNEKHVLAHICPVRLTPDQAREETARGGWIPPCYMRITDQDLLSSSSDICDVVVATGLIALVDDCIKRRFHSKQSTQLHIPLMRSASFKMNMEYVGPKRLIDEVFHRASRRGTPSRRPTA